MHFDEPGHVSLVPCTFCGRNFSKESIARHEGICQKTSRKRPVFNSSKQRDINAGDTTYKPKGRTFKTKAPSRPHGQSNWRQKHEEFINTVRAARDVTAAIKQGRELPPPPPPTVNPDYVQCPHCMRRFNVNAADRHIPFCAEQAKRLTNKKAPLGNISNEAAARASARLKYRPPPLHPSSGKRPTNETVQSASSRTTRSGQPLRVNGASRTSSSSFSKNNSNSNYSSTRKNERSIERRWDASIEPAAVKSDVRSKTGLKPSSGINRSEQLSSETQRHRAKRTVRKVAGKNTAVGYTTRNERPRHDWSSESNSDSDHNGAGYNAIAYDSQSRHRGARMYDSNQSVFKNSFKPTNTGIKSSKAATQKISHHGTYENGHRQSDEIKQNLDFYNWMKSAEVSEHASASSNSEKNSNSLPPKFCHECGSRYPIANAKFCCECGIKRIVISKNV